MYVAVMTSTRPTALGTAHEVDLDTGSVRYFENGPRDGQTVVFVHGLLVNADLWRHVVPAVVDAGLHTYTVDWPLGSHSIPVPNADLSPPGIADLIAAFLERLDLTDVTIVANDTGGAITQILMTRHPERIGRVVLVSCDAFERFFPPAFAFLPVLAKAPGSMAALTQIVRHKLLQGVETARTVGDRRVLPRPEPTQPGDPQGPGPLPQDGQQEAHARRCREADRLRQARPAGLGRRGEAVPDLAG